MRAKPNTVGYGVGCPHVDGSREGVAKMNLLAVYMCTMGPWETVSELAEREIDRQLFSPHQDRG